MKVNGVPYYPTDEETVDDYVAGTSYYRVPSGAGWYWLSFDAQAGKRLSLYPTPETADLPIIARVVVRPSDLSDPTDEPLVPREFHRYILAHVKAEAYGALEDDPETSDYYRSEFDRGVADLRRLVNSMGARRPVPARVVGIHV